MNGPRYITWFEVPGWALLVLISLLAAIVIIPIWAVFNLAWKVGKLIYPTAS